MNTPVRIVLAQKGPVVQTIEPDAPIELAVRRMAELGVGSVVVLQGDAIVGLLSDRHVLQGLARGAGRLDRAAVCDLMQTRPPTISPDTPVGWAMALMTERRTRHLPVVEGGSLCGLVSLGDLTRWLTRSLEVQVESLQRYITGA